jgi:hypothetical protein
MQKVPGIDRKVKCPGCDGQGKDYLWADRDPYEGYKMASKKECHFCGGAGHFKEGCWQFIGVVAFWEAVEKEKKKTDLIRKAKAKLTKEEKEALGIE